MKLHRTLFAFYFIIGVVVSAPANSVTMVQTDDIFRFDFDFSGETPIPPYINLTPTIRFDHNVDDFGPAESFDLEAFDGNGQSITSLRPVGPYSTASGGAIEATFGGLLGYMTSTLDTTAGYIIMRNVVGSFAIDIVTVWGGTSSQQTPSITATISELTALNCEGFSPPFDQPLSIKKKTKRTIPVDIRLLDGSGDVVTDADITAPPVINVSYQGFGVGDVAPASLELLPVGSANEGNFFRFDPGSEQWIYNLGTKYFEAPGVYLVTVTSGDTNEYQVTTSSSKCTQNFERLP